MEGIDSKSLARLADKYNTKDFIKSDPIQFPRRLFDAGARMEDVEISSIVSSWLAYGLRNEFLPVIGALHEIMGWQPYKYIRDRSYRNFEGCDDTMYRFFTYNDFYCLCNTLYSYYFMFHQYLTIGEVLESSDDPLMKLIRIFDHIRGFPNNGRSACKRQCMLMRWMVRDDGIVDMGLWKLDKSRLIIQLDTHVHDMALQLGIARRKQPDMKTAIEITNYFKDIFPDDPAKGDFALYGLGIDNGKELIDK